MAMKIRTQSDIAQANYGVDQLLNQPGGIEKMALEQLPPFIRESRDYTAFGRQVLIAHDVTGDELQIINGNPYFYYPKDTNSHAAFYGDDAQIARLQVEGEGVNVGVVTIASDDATIDTKRLMVQKFNYLERVRELSGQAVAKLEDARIVNLVETVLLGNGANNKNPEHSSNVIGATESTLAKSHLISLKKALSRNNVPLGAFVMSQTRIDDILGWEDDEVDQLTMREMLETGAKYAIWGSVKLIPSEVVDIDTIYAFAEPEYVGRMPILKDLTVQLTETANKLERGLFLYEFVGFYVASHKAVAKLLLSHNANTDDKIALLDLDEGVKAKD